MTTFQFWWVLSGLITTTTLDIKIAENGHADQPAPSAFKHLTAEDLVGCRSTSPQDSGIAAQVNAFRIYENNFQLDKASAVLTKLLNEDRCRHIPDTDGALIADLLLRSVGNALADDDVRSAREYIQTLLQTFPMIEPTLQKFPPKTVATWQAERSKIRAPMRQIEVWTSESGVLTTDGTPLAQLKTGRNQLTVPAELRRLWVVSAQATSLMRYLEFAPQSAQTLVFIPRLEAKLLTSDSPPGLDSCDQLCRQTLQLFANTHRRSIRLLRTDGTQSVDIPRGHPLEDHVTLLTSAPRNTDGASSMIAWTDFLPLGASQLYQERWFSGGLWAASQLSLAALSLWQYNRVDDTSLSLDERERAKQLTNIFAASFYISVAGSITDSLIWRMSQETSAIPDE